MRLRRRKEPPPINWTAFNLAWSRGEVQFRDEDLEERLSGYSQRLEVKREVARSRMSGSTAVVPIRKGAR